MNPSDRLSAQAERYALCTNCDGTTFINEHLRRGYLAGHSAGVRDALELAEAVEQYFKAPLMDHSAALIAGDCLRSALLDFKLAKRDS